MPYRMICAKTVVDLYSIIQGRIICPKATVEYVLNIYSMIWTKTTVEWYALKQL